MQHSAKKLNFYFKDYVSHYFHAMFLKNHEYGKKKVTGNSTVGGTLMFV